MVECCHHISYKFKPVTHVIFDLDGTLVDTETINFKAFSQVAEEYGKTYTHELSVKHMGTTESESCKMIINELNLPITPEEFKQKYRAVSDEATANVELMPGAERLVNHLYQNNIPIAIATSSGQDIMDLKATNHKLFFSQFNHIVCGGTDKEVKRGKPAPDIFLICASRFPDSPDPVDCLVFEDAPNGVKGALEAGMQVVMFPNENVSYTMWKDATLRLNSFMDFMPQLFGLPPYPESSEINI